MKVLFSPCHYIYDSKREGGEVSWAYNIAHRLAQQLPGSMVVTGYNNDRSTPTNYRVIELQSHKHQIDTSLHNALVFNLKYFFETRRRIGSNGFSLLHHVLPFGLRSTFNLFILSQNKLSHIPTVIGPIQSPLGYTDKDFDRRNAHANQPHKRLIDFSNILSTIFTLPLRWLSDTTLKKASRIIVINQYTKNLLIERNIAPDKIVIIPPGIDTLRFRHAKPAQKAQRHFEIITVNHLIKRKNTDLIIKAFNLLPKRYHHVSLKIVGDGYAKNNLEQLVTRLNLNDRVIFTGSVPNHRVSSLYANADIFVSMSRAESWGQVYLEAMASGLPIISSRNVGSESIIEDGKFGYLIAQEDVKALAAKISYLIDNSHILQKFSGAARQEVKEKYDWDYVIIPKYLQLYHELLP